MVWCYNMSFWSESLL